jgi:hypothetical protein
MTIYYVYQPGQDTSFMYTERLETVAELLMNSRMFIMRIAVNLPIGWGGQQYIDVDLDERDVARKHVLTLSELSGLEWPSVYDIPDEILILAVSRTLAVRLGSGDYETYDEQLWRKLWEWRTLKKTVQ